MGAAPHRRLALIVNSFILLCLLFILSTVLAYGFLTLTAISGRALRRIASRPEAAPAPGPPGWWQRYTVTADGYTLALPPDWQVVPLDRSALDRYAQGKGEVSLDPRLLDRAKERLNAGSGLWAALSPSDASGAAASINIIRQPLEKELSVEAFAQANIASLQKEKTLIGPIRQDWLNLTAGRVLRTRVTFRSADQGGQELQITQFYLVYRKNGYVLTATAKAEQAQHYAPTFEGIIRSLRWTA